MCEYSRRLIAWMDREVPADEAGEIELHLAACAECRGCVAEFERVSREFNAYCDELARSKGSSRAFRREPILWAAAAAVVLAVIFVYPRRQVAPVPEQANATAAVIKLLPDSARNASVQPAPAEIGTGTAAVHASRQRTHANRAVVKRGAGCCSLTATSGATANAAAAPPTPAQNANWVANEPSVQIAISAAAMFPPGALPEGIDFVADLSIGADGSVQQVRLQPQVSEFERRSTQP